MTVAADTNEALDAMGAKTIDFKEPFRILDLGCSDGAIALWIARQMQARDVPVAIDGVELHAEMAERARVRLAEAGIDGEVAVGSAVDAHKLLMPGQYDAVVAYELIEHVPDTAKLLATCERMLAPEGRVYVSTPDGTFGAGNNPNHLRAIRAIDLADMLRRRGQLTDMAVDQGLTMASYQPTTRGGEIAIYTGPGWERWSPHDIVTKGLGGSETWAVRLAEQLSGLGYIVTVYGDVTECAYRDVIFRRWEAFDPTERRACVISSRIPQLFDRPINAPIRMLWVHDVTCGNALTPARAERIDHIVGVSRWHREHLISAYPWAKAKIRQSRNGIEHSLFAGEQPERKQRVLFTSSPDRGVDKILEMWPRIREAVPEAELNYCYTGVYDEVAKQQPALRAYRERVIELSDQPGVVNIGAQSQVSLSRLMRESMVWVAPSWHSPTDDYFYETSCIGAMEAQAAGCLAVGSNWGALKETIQAGRLIDGPALGERWTDAFVAEIIDGLTNPDTQTWVRTEGPRVAEVMGWRGVAEQVQALLNGEASAFEHPDT